MNNTLCQDITKELLTGSESQRIQEAVLQQEQGEIEIFVRHGRHQKTSPPPINLLGDSDEGGLRYSAYKDMVHTVIETIRKHDREIRFGHLIVRYKANEEGMLKKLSLHYKDEVHHTKKDKEQQEREF